jgi:hypothetical protein
MNIFRVAFKMERLVPQTMTGGFDAAYLSNLTAVRGTISTQMKTETNLVTDGQSHH